MSGGQKFKSQNKLHLVSIVYHQLLTIIHYSTKRDGCGHDISSGHWTLRKT